MPLTSYTINTPWESSSTSAWEDISASATTATIYEARANSIYEDYLKRMIEVLLDELERYFSMEESCRVSKEDFANTIIELMKK